MGTARDSGFIKAFGIQVRQLREDKNLSQYELAAKANIERSQIARIELGNINASISTVKLIAEGLGVTLSELFDFRY